MKQPGLQQKNTVVKPSDHAFHHLPQYGVYKWFRGWSGGPFVGAAEPVSRRCFSGRSTSLFDVDLPGKLAKSSPIWPNLRSAWSGIRLLSRTALRSWYTRPLLVSGELFTWRSSCPCNPSEKQTCWACENGCSYPRFVRSTIAPPPRTREEYVLCDELLLGTIAWHVFF